MSSNHSTIERLKNLLKGILEVQSRPRLPKGHVDAYKLAQNESNNGTAGILLRVNKGIWFAYYIAILKVNGRCYAGQSADLEALNAFEGMSSEDRQATATEVWSAAQVDSGVQEQIEQVGSHKRRRPNNDQSTSADPRGSMSFSSERTSSTIVRPATVQHTNPAPLSQFFSASAPVPVCRPSSSSIPAQISTAFPTRTPRTHVQSDCQTSRLVSVFPSVMCQIIWKKPNGTSSVSLLFPDEIPGPVTVFLGIASKHVPWLAEALFRQFLCFTGNQGCVMLENGVTVSSPAGLTLSGASMDVIPRVFGEKMGHAITTHAVQQVGESYVQTRTPCVSLTIKPDGTVGEVMDQDLDRGVGAELMFTVGFNEGWRLQEMLFPS